jgi:hypothetical protein
MAVAERASFLRRRVELMVLVVNALIARRPGALLLSRPDVYR